MKTSGIVIVLGLAFSGCAALDVLSAGPAGGTSGQSVVGGAAAVVHAVAGVLPAPLQLPVSILGAILGVFGLAAERKRRVHRQARVETGRALEVVREKFPDIDQEIKNIILDHIEGDRAERDKFYARYIENKARKNKTEKPVEKKRSKR